LIINEPQKIFLSDKFLKFLCFLPFFFFQQKIVGKIRQKKNKIDVFSQIVRLHRFSQFICPEVFVLREKSSHEFRLFPKSNQTFGLFVNTLLQIFGEKKIIYLQQNLFFIPIFNASLFMVYALKNIILKIKPTHKIIAKNKRVFENCFH
jgi:hypothetical protein